MFELFRASQRPGLPTARKQFVYHPPISHVVADACPPAARGWSSIFVLDHPEGDGDGALMARGSQNSGFVLYVKGGRLVFDYNDFHDHTRFVADAPLGPGRREVGLKVERDGFGAQVAMTVDGRTVASGIIQRLLFMISSTGMDIGRSLAPVNDDYRAPFDYPGRIERVVWDVPKLPAPAGEVRAQVRAEMVRQ